MKTVSLETCKRLREFHQQQLTKINRQIMEIERKKDENVASETVIPAGTALPLHSPVEHPNKGKSSPKRRSSG